MSRESSPALVRLFELLELLSWRRLRERALPRSLSGAAFHGDLEMVEVFLATGADLAEETAGARSPLASAIRSGRLEVVMRLLAAGAKPDSKGAASRAAERNRVDLLRILLDSGLDPAGREASQALADAAINGKATAMRFLLERGVRLNGYDVRFTSGMAEKSGHAEIAAFLDEKRKDLAGVPDAEDRPAIEFRRMGRVEEDWSEERLEAEALAIVSSGAIDAEIDRPNPRGVSALDAAIDADATAVADAALDHGADPAAGETECAPIVNACSHGLAALVERLAPGVPAAQRDKALVEAASFGLPAIVETLLNAGANPSSTEGMRSLSKAGGPYRDEIRVLLRRALRARGARPGPALGAEGRNPRMRVAALRGVREFIKPLVDTNPDWTILALRMPIEDVSPRIAAAITRDVDCEAIFCGGSDASGTFSATRYDRGERTDQVEWTFEEVKAADAYFSDLQLFLPGCRIDSLRLSPRLDLIRIDPGAVKRLDYLVLEE